MAKRLLTGGIVLASMSIFPILADAQGMREDASACDEAVQLFESRPDKASHADNRAVVLMYKSQFCPARLTAKNGTNIRWLNIENRTSHSVWFKNDGLEESDRIFPGEHIDMTINMTQGEHPYLCGPHWEGGMTGLLIIN